MLGAADFLRRPLTDKFLHVAIVPANAYQRTKFKLPIGEIVIQGASTHKCLQVCQIATSQLHY